MSSETPHTTYSSTKYENIPPRFRKVWIQGHAEKIQKKLDVPIEEFSVSMSKPMTSSDNLLPKTTERRVSQSHISSASSQDIAESSSSLTRHKRPRTSEPVPLGLHTSDNERRVNLREKETNPAPIAYSGTPSIRQIVDSVVNANVALSSPPASRSSSPHEGLKPRRQFRQSSQSRPVTRTNSPNPSTRASTPIPSGWIAPSSRHSFRRFDIRPWGPRHLEYDYNRARKEFQAAAYFALGQYGYEPPKGVVKYKAPAPQDLPSMDDLRKVPEFAKACKKLDSADHALEEALSRGETWENTPVPEEYLQLSLEDATPEDLCIQRPNNAGIEARSRSSVTLEEAAGQFKSSVLEHSSAAPTSVPSSASASQKGTESIAEDDARSSRATSPSVKRTAHLTPGDDITHEQTAGADASETHRHSPAAYSGASSGLKRSLSEAEGTGTTLVNEEKDKSEKHSTVILGAPTRANSPGAPNAISLELEGRLGRADSESTLGSGSGPSLVETAFKESPPTSISSFMSQEGLIRMRGGRVKRMSGRKRGIGRGK